MLLGAQKTEGKKKIDVPYWSKSFGKGQGELISKLMARKSELISV
jgi:hypothetical protein